MIRVTRLNGTVLYLSAELVAMVESHHDTVITLTDGKTFVVEQRAEEVVNLVVNYRARVLALSERLVDLPDLEQPEAGHEAHLLVLPPLADRPFVERRAPAAPDRSGSGPT